METLFKRLQIEVQSELEVITPFGNLVKGYDEKKEVVKLAIMKLKHHLAIHPFADKATEIKYFKYWLPYFWKQYIYFAVLYELECNRIILDPEAFSSYLEDQKKQMAAFLADHRDLYLYYMLGKSDKDEQLFLHTPLPETDNFPEIEENSCHESMNLSRLLAYEDYKKILNEEIDRVTGSKANICSKLKFVSTKAEAVELIILLYEVKLFDNTLEQLIESFEDNTNVDLKDFTIIDNNNRARKKSANPLLDKFNLAARDRVNRLNS